MNNEHLKQIDTSLGLMVEFSKVAKGTVQKIQSMRQASYPKFLDSVQRQTR